MTSYNLGNLKILLVEDNPHWQHIVRVLLHALGVNMLTIIPDATSALSRLAEENFDILICDWELEGPSGIDLVRELRNEEKSPTPFIPIIMLTAHTQKHKVEEARDAGVTEVLTKPISAQVLYQHIVDIVEHPREFKRTAGFFGPNRRRKVDQTYTGPEHRDVVAVDAPAETDHTTNEQPTSNVPSHTSGE